MTDILSRAEALLASAGWRTDMESGRGWKWYGYAGHFIASPLCCFHMSTRVGNKLISTIGDYRPRGPDAPQCTIGAGKDAFFETYVFECDGDDVEGNPNVRDFSEIDGIRYATSLDAERGHYEFCRKYDTPDPLAATVTDLIAEARRLREALGRVQDEANTVCGDWRETASMIDSLCIAALSGGSEGGSHE